MSNITQTLSQIRPEYAALEQDITNELLLDAKRTLQEKEFAARLTDEELFKNSALYPGSLVLPTKYDDPLSYFIAARLITQIQQSAESLGFDQSGFGGFCCAPTGKVNAMAMRVDVVGSDSKVFVVFESGLFTFIDSIVRLTLAATPFDLLAGEGPSEWNEVWRQHISNKGNLTGLQEIGADLRAWLSFIKHHNKRTGLTYIPTANLKPIEASVVACMLESAELFVTAHEYVHAIKRHDKTTLDDAAVEKEADVLGGQITVSALSRRPDTSMFIAFAGIALAIEAMSVNHAEGDPYLPAAQRAELVVNAVQLDALDLELAKGIMKLYRRIFHDVLELAPSAEMA